MSVTNAMERTRLALHHIGKILFAQSTELLNPTMNHGLPPSLAASDPSLDYHAKGVDIATAAYVSELGWLANPVSTHIQSAEMHNQSVNSLALVSGRATINSLDVLTMLVASYLYHLCQALDLRAMQAEFRTAFKIIVQEELARTLGDSLTPLALSKVSSIVFRAMHDTLEATTTMDNLDRMTKVAAASTTPLIDFLSGPENAYSHHASVTFSMIPQFRARVASRSVELMKTLRHEYLTGVKNALPVLNKTKPIYQYIRTTLGVKMYGYENNTVFANGLGGDDVSIGENISAIQEAIRDGNLQAVVVGLFD
jgi:phenylalanine ammonia-lyase